MKRKLISIVMTLAIVITVIQCNVFSGLSGMKSVSAASVVSAADETKELNRLVKLLKNQDGNEIVVKDNYDTIILSYGLDNMLHFTHQCSDGNKLTTLTAQFDPEKKDHKILVEYDFFMGMTGARLSAYTNITQKNYCKSANCIPFEVTSSSGNLSSSDSDYLKKLAGTSFQLMITTLRYELATKYNIDLKYCGFSSIKSLLRVGWFKQGGKTYYYKNDKYVTGWQIIKNKKYYFNTKGIMQTGFKKFTKKTFYFEKNGVMKTGWAKLKGKTYYFDKNGVMATGIKRIDGKTYKFNKKGVCLNP